MRLCTFVTRTDQENPLVGAVKGGRVFPLKGEGTMIGLIQKGRRPGQAETEGRGHRLDDIVLKAPVPRPGKILATIVNTQAMLGGPDIRLDRPRVDMKAPSTAIGAGETIMAPSTGIRPEVELAAVIGRRLSGGTVAEAKASIFGFTILNDVTAPSDSRDDAYEAYRRDRSSGIIKRSVMRGPLFRSKNHDTFCPMGPWLVTKDEVGDWSNLRMTTRFGGMLVQKGSTSEYLFTPERIASYVSGFLSLDEGDIISCGSVGWTREALGKMDPTEFILPPRDGTLELEIQGLGKLKNRVSFA
ncbi:MAG TPA: fumarylacetoacetate hydrolase family protein [Nitrososphaerales archaeon]|nr:fumarylacetoacetate hydrolase family protein [Nitrososphaerales archaeon]